ERRRVCLGRIAQRLDLLGNSMIIATTFKTMPMVRQIILPAVAALMLCVSPSFGNAEVTAFKQAVAAGVARDDGLAEHYRESGYSAIWTGEDEASRTHRHALLKAI